MSVTSFVLSSLLSLVALIDSNPPFATCISSTIVKNVSVEGGNLFEAGGVQKLKENWLGSCGPFHPDQASKLSLVHQWFSSQGLNAHPIGVNLTRDGRIAVSEDVVSLPLELSQDQGLLSRLLTKSLLLQNNLKEQKNTSAGIKDVGWEIATDLVLTDIFGEAFIENDWKLDGVGLYGEFATLTRDCEKNLVPLEQRQKLCTRENYLGFKGQLSPWAYRWIALESFKDIRSDHSVGTRVDISRHLMEIGKNLSTDLSLNSYSNDVRELSKKIKSIFSRLDPTMDCYNKWRTQFEKLQVLVGESAKEIYLSKPLPKNTLILGFDSGFQLVTGEDLDLVETEVFNKSKRVAYVGCQAPTVSEILQYAGHDKRLIFIESCDPQKPLQLGMFDQYGAGGVEHQNPEVRFLQFHQPSVKLALEWGLTPNTTFGFSHDLQATPERYRRLFGWNNSNALKILSAPLPIVEIFSARKGETLVLKGSFQPEEKTKIIF